MIMYTNNKIKSIYEHMGDDVSRELFGCRFLYSMTDDFNYIIQANMLVSEWKTVHDKLHAFSGKKVIFGAGNMGKLCTVFFPDIQWDCYVDNFADSIPQKPHSLPIIGFSQFLELYKEALIMISPTIHNQPIFWQLKEYGISEDNIINIGKMRLELYEKQYFDLPYLRCGENEVFVDGGCFDGSTAINFMKWCDNKYKEIWAFEPDLKNLEKCKINLSEKFQNINLVAEGLWNKREIVKFNANGSAGAKIIEEGCEQIRTNRLDDIIPDKKVSFIKLDIEGAELNALKGAEKIIREQKPKLSICIYHKPEDIWEIPSLLLEYNSDYIFYIRHYSLGAAETILYAI